MSAIDSPHSTASRLLKVEAIAASVSKDVEKLTRIAAQHGVRIKDLISTCSSKVSNVEFMSMIATTRFQHLNDVKSLKDASNADNDPIHIMEKTLNDSKESTQLRNQLTEIRNELFQSQFQANMEIKKMEHELKVSRKEYYELKNLTRALENKLNMFVQDVKSSGVTTSIAFNDFKRDAVAQDRKKSMLMSPSSAVEDKMLQQIIAESEAEQRMLSATEGQDSVRSSSGGGVPNGIERNGADAPNQSRFDGDLSSRFISDHSVSAADHSPLHEQAVGSSSIVTFPGISGHTTPIRQSSIRSDHTLSAHNSNCVAGMDGSIIDVLKTGIAMEGGSESTSKRTGRAVDDLLSTQEIATLANIYTSCVPPVKLNEGVASSVHQQHRQNGYEYRGHPYRSGQTNTEGRNFESSTEMGAYAGVNIDVGVGVDQQAVGYAVSEYYMPAQLAEQVLTIHSAREKFYHQQFTALKELILHTMGFPVQLDLDAVLTRSCIPVPAPAPLTVSKTEIAAADDQSATASGVDKRCGGVGGGGGAASVIDFTDSDDDHEHQVSKEHGKEQRGPDADSTSTGAPTPARDGVPGIAVAGGSHCTITSYHGNDHNSSRHSHNCTTDSTTITTNPASAFASAPAPASAFASDPAPASQPQPLRHVSLRELNRNLYVNMLVVKQVEGIAVDLADLSVACAINKIEHAAYGKFRDKLIDQEFGRIAIQTSHESHPHYQSRSQSKYSRTAPCTKSSHRGAKVYDDDDEDFDEGSVTDVGVEGSGNGVTRAHCTAGRRLRGIPHHHGGGDGVGGGEDDNASSVSGYGMGVSRPDSPNQASVSNGVPSSATGSRASAARQRKRSRKHSRKHSESTAFVRKARSGDGGGDGEGSESEVGSLTLDTNPGSPQSNGVSSPEGSISPAANKPRNGRRSLHKASRKNSKQGGHRLSVTVSTAANTPATRRGNRKASRRSIHEKRGGGAAALGRNLALSDSPTPPTTATTTIPSTRQLHNLHTTTRRDATERSSDDDHGDGNSSEGSDVMLINDGADEDDVLGEMARKGKIPSANTGPSGVPRRRLSMLSAQSSLRNLSIANPVGTASALRDKIGAFPAMESLINQSIPDLDVGTAGGGGAAGGRSCRNIERLQTDGPGTILSCFPADYEGPAHMAGRELDVGRPTLGFDDSLSFLEVDFDPDGVQVHEDGSTSIELEDIIRVYPSPNLPHTVTRNHKAGLNRDPSLPSAAGQSHRRQQHHQYTQNQQQQQQEQGMPPFKRLKQDIRLLVDKKLTLLHQSIVRKFAQVDQNNQLLAAHTNTGFAKTNALQDIIAAIGDDTQLLMLAHHRSEEAAADMEERMQGSLDPVMTAVETCQSNLNDLEALMVRVADSIQALQRSNQRNLDRSTELNKPHQEQLGIESILRNSAMATAAAAAVEGTVSPEASRIHRVSTDADTEQFLAAMTAAVVENASIGVPPPVSVCREAESVVPVESSAAGRKPAIPSDEPEFDSSAVDGEGRVVVGSSSNRNEKVGRGGGGGGGGGGEDAAHLGETEGGSCSGNNGGGDGCGGDADDGGGDVDACGVDSTTASGIPALILTSNSVGAVAGKHLSLLSQPTASQPYIHHHSQSQTQPAQAHLPIGLAGAVTVSYFTEHEIEQLLKELRRYASLYDDMLADYQKLMKRFQEQDTRSTRFYTRPHYTHQQHKQQDRIASPPERSVLPLTDAASAIGLPASPPPASTRGSETTSTKITTKPSFGSIQTKTRVSPLHRQLLPHPREQPIEPGRKDHQERANTTTTTTTARHGDNVDNVDNGGYCDSDLVRVSKRELEAMLATGDLSRNIDIMRLQRELSFLRAAVAGSTGAATRSTSASDSMEGSRTHASGVTINARHQHFSMLPSIQHADASNETDEDVVDLASALQRSITLFEDSDSLEPPPKRLPSDLNPAQTRANEDYTLHGNNKNLLPTEAPGEIHVNLDGTMHSVALDGGYNLAIVDISRKTSRPPSSSQQGRRTCSSQGRSNSRLGSSGASSLRTISAGDPPEEMMQHVTPHQPQRQVWLRSRRRASDDDDIDSLLLDEASLTHENLGVEPLSTSEADDEVCDSVRHGRGQATSVEETHMHAHDHASHNPHMHAHDHASQNPHMHTHEHASHNPHNQARNLQSTYHPRSPTRANTSFSSASASASAASSSSGGSYQRATQPANRVSAHRGSGRQGTGAYASPGRKLVPSSSSSYSAKGRTALTNTTLPAQDLRKGEDAFRAEDSPVPLSGSVCE